MAYLGFGRNVSTGVTPEAPIFVANEALVLRPYTSSISSAPFYASLLANKFYCSLPTTLTNVDNITFSAGVDLTIPGNLSVNTFSHGLYSYSFPTQSGTLELTSDTKDKSKITGLTSGYMCHGKADGTLYNSVALTTDGVHLGVANNLWIGSIDSGTHSVIFHDQTRGFGLNLYKNGVVQMATTPFTIFHQFDYPTQQNWMTTICPYGASDAIGKIENPWNTAFFTTAPTITSDQNDKNTINDSVLGINFITKLRPVSYKLNVNGRVIVSVDEEKKEPIYENTAGVRLHQGLIAQEVEDALEECEIATNDFAGFIHDTSSGKYSLRYEEFIPPIIKAIKELNTRLTALE